MASRMLPDSASVPAEGQLDVARVSPDRMGAAVNARRKAVGPARDDVHHARDGVGAVDRRSAVAQYLHALHDASRNRVEIGGAGDAAAG